jgi:hypothetical protein
VKIEIEIEPKTYVAFYASFSSGEITKTIFSGAISEKHVLSHAKKHEYIYLVNDRVIGWILITIEEKVIS